MSRRKPAAAKFRIPSEPSPRAAKPQAAGQAVAKPQADAGVHSHLPSPAAIRETIESLAIAFVLAFLFRTFEAEAFVIPTGSMAPTLMGRHKDLVCPMCGYPYRVGASEEVDRNENPRGDAFKVAACTCPMCRYTADVDKNNPQKETYPSYNGDRILVDKLAYEFNQPKRWDVVVFHYPNDATTNYIKRLVGLPGETVRIQQGDIWTRPSGKKDFHIERKRPEKLLAMLQPVFDNDYMPAIAKHGWPERWKPERPGAAGAWQPSDDSVTFSIDGQAAGEQWLRYRHLVPSYGQWADVEVRRLPAPKPEPQLIKDFTAFDTSRPRGAPAPAVGLHWVGDLAVECSAEVESDAGTLVFELRKGGRRFQCRIDVATGRATLSIRGGDVPQFHPTALTAVRGKGRHAIRFSNCDDELLLWVDGSLVQFDAPTSYDGLGNTQPRADDKEPVGIASAGAAVRISHLRVLRDIYYIAVDERRPAQAITDYDYLPDFFRPESLDEWILSHPAQRSVEFPLRADQFLMLGDNSANSQDGRLWGNDYWVDRDLLIGKAMFVYWPHSWHYIPYIDVPFWPNFPRMRLVR
jgi:signal peptidase I